MKIQSLFLLLLLLTFCTDDKSVFEGNSPLKTSVVNITPSGADVAAEMTAPVSGTITDRGFYWTEDTSLTYLYAQRKSLGPGDANFTTSIKSNLPKDRDVIINSYITVDKKTIHGTLVRFRGQGSEGLVLSDFTPKTARARDEITITGSGFSSSPTGNTVKLNDNVMTLSFISENVLKFLIPTTLSTVNASYTLTVTTAGITKTASSQFQYDASSSYQITATNKTAVAICDDIQLTIVNVPTGETPTIFFNDAAAIPYARSGNLFNVIVPVLPLSTTSITLQASILPSVSTYGTPITFNKPQIISFSGALTTGTTVNVTGQNLPGCTLTARVNGASVTLLNKSATHFEFVVPAGAGSNFNMDFYVNGSSASFMTYNFH